MRPKPEDDDIDVEIEGVRHAYGGFLKVDVYRVRHKRFDGIPVSITRELVERGRSVGVLPYDPKTDKVLLIRQYLIGSHVAGRAPRPLQVVAGMVDKGDRRGERAS